MVSCWEWWGVDGTPHWVYNRWQLWTPAPTKYSWDGYETTDLYAAARPWQGQEWKLVSLYDWEPRSINATCYTAATFSLGFGGSSVDIPYQMCEDYWLDINTNSRKIGIDYLHDDGTWFGRTGQMYMDVAGSYEAADRFVLPVNADYNWATVAYCSYILPGAPACEKNNWVHKDSGW